MKFAIDVSQAVYETGVSVYTRELVAAMLTQLKTEESLFLYAGVLRRKENIVNFINNLSKSSFSSGIFPIPPTAADIFFNRLHFVPIDFFIGKCNVFHSSDWTQPKSSAAKITTVHDLAPLKYPKYTDKSIQAVHARRLAIVRKEVDVVIVPSESTKLDCIEYGIDEKRLVVIPEAVASNFRKAQKIEIEAVLKKYQLPANYALVIGTAHRKNLPRIAKAFLQIQEKSKLDQLVVVGRKTDDVENNKYLHMLGNVPFEDLSPLYTGASVLVYTSLYEGFGLPILEAFVTETPVVTSDVSSMPEAAGNAAILVDPLSIDDIADGILDALQKRSLLVKSGMKQVKSFSWIKAATETLAVYRQSSV